MWQHKRSITVVLWKVNAEIIYHIFFVYWLTAEKEALFRIWYLSLCFGYGTQQIQATWSPSLGVHILGLWSIATSTVQCVLSVYCKEHDQVRNLLGVSFPFQKELDPSFDDPSVQHLLHNILLLVRGWGFLVARLFAHSKVCRWTQRCCRPRVLPCLAENIVKTMPGAIHVFILTLRSSIDSRYTFQPGCRVSRSNGWGKQCNTWTTIHLALGAYICENASCPG